MSDVSWIPRIGDEFAGYRLVSLLGHGGMSIVYRAEHIALERTVALKLLSPRLSDDEDFRERFQRESKVAASLEHPNIIPIYEAGGENGVFYIAMRYVDGADLKTRLKESGRLEAQQVVSFVAQVAAALEAAHARGLIHRDVKPANILIAPGAGLEGSDHVYLSDFGVAKNTGAAGLTKTGLFVGTAEYASPEQIEGKELDGRADIYSLGCVTYEALTGAPTYEKESEVAMMYAHLLEPPPKLSERRPDLGFPVDEVIAKAVAKSRDDRYARPSEFALALRQAVGANAPVGPETILAGSALTAPAAPAEKPAEPEPTPTEPEPTPQPTAAAAAGASNRRKLIAGGGILAVIVAAGVLIPLLALSGGKSSSPETAAARSTGAITAGTPTVAPEAASLLSVVAPSQVTKECTAQSAPANGAVETFVCVSAPTDPTSVPNAFRFSFYPRAQALLRAYGQEFTRARGAGNTLVKCGSAPAGERAWIHPTGKRGGRFFCHQDAKGNFVIVWTHEKLGSTDHVDMLGTATEPGRAPPSRGRGW